jgi:L-iditol 2-dehydrogenase
VKALYYVGDRAMEMRDIPKPTVKAGQYLVQVKANGICGSDFEGYILRSRLSVTSNSLQIQ